jgi:hypothetical protein
MKIVKDGNLHFWIRTGLSFVGAGAIFLSVLFIHEKTVMWVVACLGLGLGAIGYYSAQAAIFGLKPFADKPVQDIREKEALFDNE